MFQSSHLIPSSRSDPYLKKKKKAVRMFSRGLRKAEGVISAWTQCSGPPGEMSPGGAGCGRGRFFLGIARSFQTGIRCFAMSGLASPTYTLAPIRSSAGPHFPET